MSESLLGRTNQSFPKIWLRLEARDRRDSGEDFQSFVDAAASTQVPLDISAAPALFGGLLRDNESVTLIQVSPPDFENSNDSKSAADSVQAHLIQTLSSIGRPYIDFYFLRLRSTLEEDPLSGIMEALEFARNEGHVRYFGLYVENLGSTLGNWQFHDAFEVISVPASLSDQDRQTLKRMALQRRVGFLVRSDSLNTRLEPDETLILQVKDINDVSRLGEVA